jgi:ABC-type branched-subunit amino acid transport system substrate-binding protein
MGGKAKVAGLIMNNDFGKAYDVGFKAFLAQSPEKDNIEFISETFEPQAPTLKDPMTTLAAQNPNVFVAMMAGAPCTQAITEAAENGLQQSADYMFLSSTCKAASFVGKEKVGGDGSASDGWWIFGGGQKDFNSESMSDDAYVAWARDLLAKAGYDYKTSGSFGTGFFFGWPMVQALQIAGEFEGGLNRTNLAVAVRAMDMTHPSLIEGIKFNMNGNADVYFVEGSDISQYDAATQEWVSQGDPIDLSGQSKPCAFDQTSATCS